ncbi:flagellin [Exiguobacterium sp. SH3S2]|uniref:flagellin N-terminal helical domain-containing protein n=1 Tax=unclassified Exiguobacterium TaxID=2644629 RepID=UPI00103AAA48|nr:MULTISPECIES: flagellin [unclassified Exiguobacterium]TCI48996.1 flagellin [Exiguobacterium sp. SH3S3]TCI63860.1 flagellin [Exiguobacterium sp. SH3S2]
MKITNNIQALKAYTSLSLNQTTMKKTMDRLSSGVRINKASDDAAGLAISEKMRMRLDSLSMAERNTLDGISLTQTLEGGMNETHSLLQRMRELSVQAANGTLSPDDTKAIQEEINALTEEVSRIAETTEFNSKKIMNGDYIEGYETLFFQLGAGSGEGVVLNVADMRAEALGIDGLDVMTQAGASDAIAKFDKAINDVSLERSKLGAIQNRLEANIGVVTIGSENLTASESRIRDADMAREMMDFARLNILNQSGMAMIAQSNALPQGVLQLLN